MPPMSINRRSFLRTAGYGLGSLALARLLQGEQGSALPTHHPAKAKRVLFLHMAGAPSQLDLFDPKPKLVELDKQPVPESFIRGERFAFIKGHPKVLASPYRFARHGQSGAEFSELLPRMSTLADRWTILRAMHTTEFNHAPAQLFLSTGHPRAGRPSFGAWMSHGLGTLNENLPTYVVLNSGRYGPDGGASLWGAGFLEGRHQGVRLRSNGAPVLFLEDPPELSREARRDTLDTLGALNREHAQRTRDPEIDTRIAQYELAFRMQQSCPEFADLSGISAAERERYGVVPGEVRYGNNCLLARRLLERGVRFVELHHWGWDSHGTSPDDDIVTSLKQRCGECDGPTAALLEDLAASGLLQDTLVIWGGEFGRSCMNEERDGSRFFGRDHHAHAFTLLLAGAGLRAGTTYGATDELGYRGIEGQTSVHDLHATLLHLLGFDHERLTARFQGRDYRLTDVHGRVVREILS